MPKKPAPQKRRRVSQAVAAPAPDAAPKAGGVHDPVTIRDFGYAGDVGASAHYADPAYYTATYFNRRHDIDYYVQKARLSRGPVLEYGAGNGRITVPLARAGLDVEGIDLSQAMLDDNARRLALEPPQVRARVKLHQGDMRSVRLERRFALVIAPFNTFLHLYDRRDVEAFLASVRSHLRPDGEFLFDFSIPQPADLARDPEHSYSAPNLVHPETGESVSYAERFEYDPLRQLLLVRLEFKPEAGSAAFTVPLTHRQFFPREIEALLHYNGFERILFSADFTDLAADRHVDSIVVSCRAARGP